MVRPTIAFTVFKCIVFYQLPIFSLKCFFLPQIFTAESATYCLAKNAVRVFKEMGVSTLGFLMPFAIVLVVVTLKFG